MLTSDISSHWKFPMMLIQHSVTPDWLFNTPSRVLRGDWLMLENNEKATLNIIMPYYILYFSFYHVTLDNTE